MVVPRVVSIGLSIALLGVLRTAPGLLAQCPPLDLTCGAGVSVTPDGGTTTARYVNGGPFTQTFQITNTGPQTLSLTLTCGFSRGSCSVVGSGALSLPGFQSTQRSVSFTTGPTGGSGVLTLTASGSGVSDQGRVTVPVLEPAAQITVPPPVTVPIGTVGRQAVFWVQNMGSQAETWSFSCRPVAPVTCVSAAPTSAQLEPGVTPTAVTVTYDVGSEVGSGAATLQARHAATGITVEGAAAVRAERYGVVVTAAAPPAERIAGSEGHAHSFFVTNTGSSQTAYAWSCVPSSNVTCRGVTPASASLADGQTVEVSVRYDIGTAGPASVGLSAQGAFAADAETVSFPVNAYGVDVVVIGGSVTHTIGAPPQSRAFRLRNESTVAVTFSLRCGAAGAVACQQANLGSTTILPQGDSIVAVPYLIGSMGAGWVELNATSPAGNGLTTSARLNVTVVAPPVTVTADSIALAIKPTSTGPYRTTFVVANGGSGSATFDFECFGAGSISCEADPAPLEIGGMGDAQPVTVSYRAGPSPGSASLTLRAVSRSNTTDSASAQVALRVERFGVRVTPVDSAVNRRDGQTRVETFSVANTGSINAEFALECSGDGELDCVGVANAVTVAAGQSVAVPVTYRIGDVSPGNALSLSANHVDWRAITAVGRYAVSVVDAGVAVTTVRSLGVVAGSIRSHRVAVHNTGSAYAQVAVAASCSGAAFASPCDVTPTVLGLGPGGRDSVTVSFLAAQQVGSQGQLVLRATNVEDQLAADSGIVAVSIGQPVPLTISTASTSLPGRRDRSACLTVAAGPAAASECDVLRVVHPLPAVRTMNRQRVPVMLYNSDLAHPYPAIAADIGLPPNGLTPDSVTGRLVVDGAERDIRTWSGAVVGPGRAARIALSFDGFQMGTGVYRYDLEVVAYAGGEAMATAASGEVVVVNRKQSRYGAGWWLAGLEQLWFLPGAEDRMLWVGGDGSWAVYTPVPGSGDRWIAPASTRPDTLRYDPNLGRYVRTLPGLVEVQFDAQGRHVETRNRLGHVTRFVYDGDPSNQHRERLSEIHVPLPAAGALVAYRFEYGDGLAPDANVNNDRLDRVLVLPGRAEQRVVQTVRTGANQNGSRIKRFVEPGGRSIAFGYQGSPNQHRMVWREDGRGYRTTYSYDSASRFVASEREAGSGQPPVRLAVRAGESVGLASPVDTADAHVQVDGPRTDVDDVTRYWLAATGAPRRIVDAVGNGSALERADPRFPGSVTSVRSPSGFVTHAFHDARGNVDSVVALREAGRAVTTYEWDHRFDVVRRAVRPTGETTQTDYDPTTGNRRWVQEANDPGSRVLFRYDADGLLRAVDPPLMPADSLAYDAFGNLRLAVSAAGHRRIIHRDGFGRDTLVVSPVDTSQTVMMRRRRTYDAAGRVVREVTAADAVRLTHVPGAPTMPAESTIVWTEYDPEGNVRRVARVGVPDTNGIDSIVTEWRYDALGRAVAEVAPDGGVDSTVYDEAGNVVATHTRRGHVVTAFYDPLNRLLRRISPEVDYADFTWVVPDTTWRYPLFRGTGALIAADTVRFAYDAAGNVVQADNRHARVSRRYHADGTLAEEISRIRSFTGDDWGLHVYRQRYGYDRSGRRSWHAHPTQLAPDVAGERRDTVYYGYDAFGRLDTVRTAFEGLTFTYAYDDAGRLREVRSPGGVVEQRQYDQTGHMRHRSVASGGTWLMRDSLTFDAGGRVLLARGLDGRHDTRMGYTGLGVLARSFETLNDWVGTGWTSQTEELYSADALGNWRSSFRSSLTTPSQPSEETADYRYEAGTGRLIEQSKRAGLHWPNPSNDSVGVLVTTHEYDAAGNKLVETTLGPADAPAVLRRSAFYYDAENRLRIVDKRSCYVEPVLNGPPLGNVGCNIQTRLAFNDRWAFEEYRYDALGRRVLTRSWEDFCAGDGCGRSVQRTVWDGHEVLYEIRYPGVSEADGGVIDLGDSIPGPPSCSPGCDSYEPQEIFPYGVIGYVHAAGVDEPLMAIRMFYGPLRSAPFAVIPHANWRGAYVTGTDGAGRTLGECNAQAASCVAIQWPGARQFTGFKPRGYAEDGPPAWMGSLLGGKRDASGQLYMRNRYYDPETGRFTQEDPIGLAGGLNLYGFAGGDPVNYRDPFGLSECTIFTPEECFFASLTVSFGRVGKEFKGRLLFLNASVGASAGTTTSLTLSGDGLSFEADVSGGASASVSVGPLSAGGRVSCSATEAECSAGGAGSAGVSDEVASGRFDTNGSVGFKATAGGVTVGANVNVVESLIGLAGGIYQGSIFIGRGLLGLLSPFDLDKPIIRIRGENDE